MRKAYSDICFLSMPVPLSEDVLVGISLGFDFCSEHEWGIQGIKNLLGIKEPSKENMGTKARKATLVPDCLFFMEKKLPKTKKLEAEYYAVLVMDDSAIQKDWHTESRATFFFKNIRSKFYGDNTLVTEWDENGFAIYVKGEKDIANLKKIHQAILDKDICIGLTSNKNPFSGSGLRIFIHSQVPKELEDSQIEVDTDYFKLQDALAEANVKGLEDRLHAAGKSWFALHPCWNNFRNKDGELRTTKYPFIFWLNPREQKKYKWGYVTFEELEQWIEDKGTIMDPNA